MELAVDEPATPISIGATYGRNRAISQFSQECLNDPEFRAAGARVTGVDNPGKQAFMKSVGADEVIDYTREDFTVGGPKYDLILDLVAHRSVFAYNRALKPKGRYFFVGGSAWLIVQLLVLGRIVGRRKGKRLQMLVAIATEADLERAAALCLAGDLTVRIDRRYSLEDVPEALRALGAGEIQGKAVVEFP